jgi:hypothetical protein
MRYNASKELKKQTFTIEISQYEPDQVITWVVNFDRRTTESENTTFIPTGLHLTCKLKPKNEYILALLDVDYEIEASLVVKFLFKTVFCMQLI